MELTKFRMEWNQIRKERIEWQTEVVEFVGLRVESQHSVKGQTVKKPNKNNCLCLSLFRD